MEGKVAPPTGTTKKPMVQGDPTMITHTAEVVTVVRPRILVGTTAERSQRMIQTTAMDLVGVPTRRAADMATQVSHRDAMIIVAQVDMDANPTRLMENLEQTTAMVVPTTHLPDVVDMVVDMAVLSAPADMAKNPNRPIENLVWIAAMAAPVSPDAVVMMALPVADMGENLNRKAMNPADTLDVVEKRVEVMRPRMALRRRQEGADMGRRIPTQVAGTMNLAGAVSMVPLDTEGPRKPPTDHLNVEGRNIVPLAMEVAGSTKALRDMLPVMAEETRRHLGLKG